MRAKGLSRALSIAGLCVLPAAAKPPGSAVLGRALDDKECENMAASEHYGRYRFEPASGRCYANQQGGNVEPAQEYLGQFTYDQQCDDVAARRGFPFYTFFPDGLCFGSTTSDGR